MAPERCYVIMMAAATLCGRIGPLSPGSSADRQWLVRMRRQTDASLLGAATLRQDDPLLQEPTESRLRCVVTGSGRLPVNGRLFRQPGNPPLVYCGTGVRQRLMEQFAGRAQVVPLAQGTGSLVMQDLVADLSRRGVRRLLLEGGGRLNYSFWAEDLVDEICLTLAPKLSGDRHAARLLDGQGPLGSPFVDLNLVHCEPQTNGELFLRYRRSLNQNK